MKLTKTIYLNKNTKGEYWSNITGSNQMAILPATITLCENTYNSLRKRNLSQLDRENCINQFINTYNSTLPSQEVLQQQEEQKQLKLQICTNLINFFKDFDFEPNFRFVNTLKKNCSTVDNARDYVCNYFKLTDNSFKDDVIEKVKSQEFNTIIKQLQQIPSNTNINSRFKVYYGSQGTGKTTQALKETQGIVMVCHSAMLPSDLLEDFKFENGQPTFKPSALWQAMENGTKICLDEINLLPFESLRFLQSILDNKTEISYKGKTIHINNGFQIIGTMNLTVNGSVFNLPEPLVDRALELREYRLTPEQLTGALL